jgi:hypothetical protein
MDVSTALEILKTGLPLITPLAASITRRPAPLSAQVKAQLQKMLAYTEEDIAKLKAEVEEIRKIGTELNLKNAERGGIPWSTPPNVNGFSAWRYRRSVRRISHLCEDFRASLNGIQDVISCGAGVMDERSTAYTVPTIGAAGATGTGTATTGGEEGDELVRELRLRYETVGEKVLEPAKHSIDDLTNAMEQYLTECRLALQQISRRV